MTTLQRLLLPTLDLCPQTQLYVNCVGGSWFSHAAHQVHLLRGSSALFDTYFNGFSVGKWRRHTTVDQVVLQFEASGELEVEVVLNHPNRDPRVVAAGIYRADERTWFHLEAPPLQELGDGLLYLRFRGLGDEAVVFGGAVSTPDVPAREVQLGVVITTYNRPQYLDRNLTRLATGLKDTPSCSARLQVLVVDNASNVELVLPADAPITVIPNRNLGGAGGFARGLMRLRAAGEVSHVVFMDDDISFDPEILFRTLELLSYARDPQLCVAGAMLLEETQHVQFEAGAAFLAESMHPVRAIGRDIDLRDWQKLVENEVERPAGYGAWWYFAFPMSIGATNPLPVFVRGDDICFGVRHAGNHTVTLNGIGVWHQSFAQKNGPPAFYYDARNIPLVSLLASERFSAFHLTLRFTYQTIRMLLAMKYDTASAHIEGTRQFLEGPAAWLAMDHEEVNRDIRRHQGERPAPLQRAELGVRAYKPQSRLIPKIGGVMSILCLSGHLLPARLTRRPPVALDLGSWSPVGVLAREEVLYRYEPTAEGFVVRRDRKRFFTLLGQMVRTAARISRRFDDLKREYRDAYPALTSDAYWHRQFGEAARAADQHPGRA